MQEEHSTTKKRRQQQVGKEEKKYNKLQLLDPAYSGIRPYIGSFTQQRRSHSLRGRRFEIASAFLTFARRNEEFMRLPFAQRQQILNPPFFQITFLRNGLPDAEIEISNGYLQIGTDDNFNLTCPCDFTDISIQNYLLKLIMTLQINLDDTFFEANVDTYTDKYILDRIRSFDMNDLNEEGLFFYYVIRQLRPFRKKNVEEQMVQYKQTQNPAKRFL